MKSNRKLHHGEEVAQPEEQGPIDVTWEEVGGKPATYPPSTHYHNWEDITGKPDFLDFMNWKSKTFTQGTDFVINWDINEPVSFYISPTNNVNLTVSPDNQSKFFGIRARDTVNIFLNDTATTRFVIGSKQMPTIPAGGTALVYRSPLLRYEEGQFITEYYVIGDLLTKGKPIKNINQSAYILKKEDVGYWLIFYQDCEITYNTYDTQSEFEGEANNRLVNLSFVDGTEYLTTEEGLSTDLYGGGVFGIKVRANKSGRLFGSLKPEE